MPYPRAAFLPDTFHEVNGVAHTSRHLEAFARRRQIPFLSIHCGLKEERFEDGCVSVVQLKRGPAKIGLDANLDYDPLLLRYYKRVAEEVEKFGADLIHVTGPGDMGTLGYCVARRLGIPLVISWHTSLHEYAARRLERLAAFLGPAISHGLGRLAERIALHILTRFYRKATVVLAPNPEVVDSLGKLTGRPVFLTKRGVDTDLFKPARRPRVKHPFRIGYVGRLTAEKNVRFLADLGDALEALHRAFELVIGGEGREEACCARMCRKQSSPVFCVANVWRMLMRAWTCLFSRHAPTRLGTWCSKLSHPEFRQWLPIAAAPDSSSNPASPA